MNTQPDPSQKSWTIYLCQDKHLDYNWCGTNTEIEIRMVDLIDYYLDQAEQHGSRWNLDSTLWFDVYRRHRGNEGITRLETAIRNGYFGFGANHSVQLWGMMSTETAIRALYGGGRIGNACKVDVKTALIMESWGIVHGAASVLTESGIEYLARGTYPLRAEEYHRDRAPFPLFTWIAPNGKKLLVYWPPYTDTKSWGGYAEAFELASIAGEDWNALEVQSAGDRNTPEIFEKRCDFIRRTVDRHTALGDDYPVSSIMLLGTGWDNWTKTDDYRRFIDRYNAECDDAITIVDARYDQYFEAVKAEVAEKSLMLRALDGSFGITWEEWPAHLAGFTADFREAERLVRIGEARYALGHDRLSSTQRTDQDDLLDAGNDAIMQFLEHDMGGSRPHLASVSAGVRAAASTQALDVGTTLAGPPQRATPRHAGAPLCSTGEINWRGGTVRFGSARFGLSSITISNGDELLPASTCDNTNSTADDAAGVEAVASLSPLFGELLVTRFDDGAQMKSIFPDIAPHPRTGGPERFEFRENDVGTSVLVDGNTWGFDLSTHWFFYHDKPWIDVTYRIEEGWDSHAQTLQICFPSSIQKPVYWYDSAGVILTAGPKSRGGDDLPGANPEFFAAQSFIAATGNRQMILITPDAYLFQRCGSEIRATGYDGTDIPCQIVSMPMMNLTRQDLQFRQGGRRGWKFRYRIVFLESTWNPIDACAQAQQFATPPFLWTPGVNASTAEIDALDIDYSGGPLVAAKRGIDGRSLILRFLNVTDQQVSGSVKMPEAYIGGKICDALERPLTQAMQDSGRIMFSSAPKAIVTVALGPSTGGTHAGEGSSS